MPNLAILSELRRCGFEVHYAGSGGIEKELAIQAGLPFHQIQTGKLRRYFSVQNFLDLFRLIMGFFQALGIMLKVRPKIVFSKGGFVAVPVTIAAWICRIPVVTHESDYSPGLANKIIAPFSKKILYTFPETGRFLPAAKAIHVGTPVRAELFAGDPVKGRVMCGFQDDKPILLVMGGSQGAQRINDALKEILPRLVATWNVVHLTGKGKSIGYSNPGYRAFEFMGAELKDLFAAAQAVVSRAGANSIFELLALKKPMLLIPLEFGSRGDQVLNAKSFEANGWAITLSETSMSEASLFDGIVALRDKGSGLIKNQAGAAVDQVPVQIVKVLRGACDLP
jgi:UDP-N-acetylglucosamine--N-acetylmuramyl-(pentapeptide) pyrophosphoryl-undecaprenol N-acetylglucosamine transferase